MNELNRKAMVLGNKLAPRMDGDRKAASTAYNIG